jgi:hypothetical protein
MTPRKPTAPAPARGTQSKEPFSLWLDPADKARVVECARRRDLPPSVFARKALMTAVSVAEQQDAMEAQGPMLRMGRL